MKGAHCPAFFVWKASTIVLIMVMFLVSGCNFPPYTLAQLEAQSTTAETILSGSEYIAAESFNNYLSNMPQAFELFGMPVSDAFIDPTTGKTVQYFQKVRLETDSANDDTQISLTPLGLWLLPEESQEVVIIDENCVTMPGHEIPLCSAFRTFYEQHDGAQLFGKPISYVIQTGDRYYQYFENVCLIYAPSAPDELKVTLANLGEIYLLSKEPYYQAITRADIAESLIPRNLPTQQLSVFVAFEDQFITTTQQQIVYIQVLNESKQPAANVTLHVVAVYPDGSRQQYRLDVTDIYGVSSFAMTPFTNRNLETNDLIVVEVIAQSEQASGQNSGWFRIWE